MVKDCAQHQYQRTGPGLCRGQQLRRGAPRVCLSGLLRLVVMSEPGGCSRGCCRLCSWAVGCGGCIPGSSRLPRIRAPSPSSPSLATALIWASEPLSGHLPLPSPRLMSPAQHPLPGKNLGEGLGMPAYLWLFAPTLPSLGGPLFTSGHVCFPPTQPVSSETPCPLLAPGLH